MQNHFTVIVVGENPDEIIKKYDKNLETESYLVYKFKDREKYHKQYIDLYRKALETKSDEILDTVRENLQIRLNEILAMDDIGFYTDLTADLDIDQETGDAYSSENCLGKYDTCNLGGRFAIPFTLNDGSESYQAKVGDIDFSKLHMANIAPYQVAWETVMEGRKPIGAQEEQIYENMKNRVSYFQSFETKEKYIAWSCAFWAYAIVDKKEWNECEGGLDDQIQWVSAFYDKYIKKLKKNTLLTIYECTRFN